MFFPFNPLDSEFDSDWLNDCLIVREVFTSKDGRICGTEWEFTRVWQGRDSGYTWRCKASETRVFRLLSEAGLWRAELDSALATARVQGGTVREWLAKQSAT